MSEYTVTISARCFRCGKSAAVGEIYKAWLSPVYVWRKEGWFITQLCPVCARWSLRYWIKVRWKLRIGKWLSRALGPPGYSGCGRCGTTWWFAESHSTTFDDGRGCFPLCQRCWQELTPGERWPFYERLCNEWAAQGGRLSEEEYAKMVEAVFSGR